MKIISNYMARHQNQANQVLHVIGVPLTFIVSLVLLGQQRWWWAAGAFVGGYVLQFIGHAIEGNDAGETVLVKKLLGKPYVSIAPGSKESKFTD